MTRRGVSQGLRRGVVPVWSAAAIAFALLVTGCDRRGPSGGAAGNGSVMEVTGRLVPAPPSAVLPAPSPPAENAVAQKAGAEHDAGQASEAEAVAEEAPAPTSGRPSPSCVSGWFTPARGSALRKAALEMMRIKRGERFFVDEMRYFVGPEDAEVMGPPRKVERWYVKAYTDGPEGRRMRWLVRRARVGRGVDAVAPYDSKGYGPGTWTRVDATDPSLADPFQYPCDVAKPTEKCMGLPREVLGCLSGT